MTTKIPDGLHVFLFTDAGLLIAGPIPFSVDRIIGSYSIDGTIYILSEYWGFIRMVPNIALEELKIGIIYRDQSGEPIPSEENTNHSGKIFIVVDPAEYKQNLHTPGGIDVMNTSQIPSWCTRHS
jgi:hypothetical protein